MVEQFINANFIYIIRLNKIEHNPSGVPFGKLRTYLHNVHICVIKLKI